MERVGIICEFNPFHNGHRFLLDSVRAAGGKEIVCVMSGCFTQRGDAAFLPPSERAQSAVCGGADAVFLLPFPWSSASASGFAEAGLYLLQLLGCDTVAFGSECGDVNRLAAIAAQPVPKPAPGQATASVYPQLSPNDILGVEYMRAAVRLCYNPSWFTVCRTGAQHLEKGSVSGFISSTGARIALRNGQIPEEIPKCTADLLRTCLNGGKYLCSDTALSDILTVFWRLADETSVSAMAECGGGVAGRLIHSAKNAENGSDFFRLAASKKHTDARLRRAALFGFLGVAQEYLHTKPVYFRLFAGNSRAKQMLKHLPSAEDMCLVSNVRNIPKTEEAQRQLQYELKAESLYTHLLSKPLPAGSLWKSSPFFLPDAES